MQHLYDSLFYSKAVNDLFSDKYFIKQMLRFESALAATQAAHGIIPKEAALVIEDCCASQEFRIELLTDQTGLGGNANIPLIRLLTQAVATRNSEAARYVHFGATSQDVIDTAIMMQTRDALKLIQADVNQLIIQLVDLVKVHRHTIMIGRTLGQHARPITFGFKVSRWLDSLLRSRKQVEDILQNDLVLQLGGAVGTLSSMEDHGIKVVDQLASALELKSPAVSWHAQRDRFANIAALLGILQGNLGKIAEDIMLLMQTEIGEVFESAVKGKGGSSTMPHKRNPIGSIAISANSKRVPALVSTMLQCMHGEHERAMGAWHAEWETMSTLIKLVAGSVRQAVEVTKDLEVDVARMRQNIEITRGLIYAENLTFALTKFIGKSTATEWVENFCKEARDSNSHLKIVIQNNSSVAGYLSQEKLDEAFSAEDSTGLYEEFINRVLRLV